MDGSRFSAMSSLSFNSSRNTILRRFCFRLSESNRCCVVSFVSIMYVLADSVSRVTIVGYSVQTAGILLHLLRPLLGFLRKIFLWTAWGPVVWLARFLPEMPSTLAEIRGEIETRVQRAESASNMLHRQHATTLANAIASGTEAVTAATRVQAEDRREMLAFRLEMAGMKRSMEFLLSERERFIREASGVLHIITPSY